MWAQGNESGLTRQGSQALDEVVWVPSGDLSAQLDAFLVCRGADQVDGEVSDDGHVFCAMAFAQTRLSSAKTTSSIQCSWFSMPQWPRTALAACSGESLAEEM